MVFLTILYSIRLQKQYKLDIFSPIPAQNALIVPWPLTIHPISTVALSSCRSTPDLVSRFCQFRVFYSVVIRWALFSEMHTRWPGILHLRGNWLFHQRLLLTLLKIFELKRFSKTRNISCSLFLRDSLSSRFKKAHQVARDLASPWELMISSASPSDPIKNDHF